MADQDGVDFVLSTGIGTRPRVGRWVSGEVVLMMADKMHTRPCCNEYTCQVYIAISDINQISNINWSDIYIVVGIKLGSSQLILTYSRGVFEVVVHR